MEPYLIGLIGMGVMFALIVLHVPIGVAMGIAGVATFGMIRGDFGPAMTLFGTETVSKVSSAELAVIPLFLLMGSFATVGGLSADLYRIAHALIGHIRGGLAVATIGGCAGFGAICGSSVATATTMTRIALPEMMKRNYSERLATGSIAAGGTLGMLIPPSIILVLYGVLTEQFVKTLFVAALLPGLLAVALHVVTIMIIVRLRPELASSGDRQPWSETLRALRDGWTAVALMIAVSGGIYAGVFSVNESAAVGAFLAFLIALLRRRLLVNRAASATLLPLYQEGMTCEEGADALAAAITPRLPLSVVLLGMGADMHTASIFPGADRLEEALSPRAPLLIPMRAPGAPEPRVTLSAEVLNGALRKHVLIMGDEKRAALDNAKGKEPVEAPINAILSGTKVHWAE